MTARTHRLVVTLALGAFALVLEGRPAAAQSPRSPRSVEADLDRLERSAFGQLQAERARAARAEGREGDDRVVDVMIRGSVSADAVRAMGAQVNTVAGPVLTARMPLAAAAQVARLPGVASIRLATPLKRHNDLGVVDDKANLKRTTGVSSAGWNGNDVVLGFVDSGIQYQHDDFKNPDGTTRLISIWDQNAAGTPPFGFGYGNECTQAQINAGTCTEVDAEGHGTHVAGIAAGDGSATGNAVPRARSSW
jgi:subtilisin family serine protease